MLYTVYVSTQNGEIPVIITNEREIIPLNIHNLNKRNWDVDDIYRKKVKLFFSKS